MKKKTLIVFFILAVLLCIANICYAVFASFENAANVLTAISGWVSFIATITVAIIAYMQNKTLEKKDDEINERFIDIQKNISNLSSQILLLAEIKEMPMIEMSTRGIYKNNKGTLPLNCKCDNSCNVFDNNGIAFSYDNYLYSENLYLRNISRIVINEIAIESIVFNCSVKDKIEVFKLTPDKNCLQQSINYDESVNWQIKMPFNNFSSYTDIDATFMLTIKTDIRKCISYKYRLHLAHNIPPEEFLVVEKGLIEAPYFIKGNSDARE